VAKRERVNQRLRTRKELLLAAQRLLKQGRTPNIAEIAEAALVSRATAYRYFPTVDALLVEAPLDAAVPTAETIFVNDSARDPADRVDRAEAALHEIVYRNEAQLRLMLAGTLTRKPGVPGDEPAGPRRQNRRTDLITAALAPVRGSFVRPAYRRLCAALAIIFGTEGMIVCQDVLQIEPAEARRVKSWAVRTLVNAALEESKPVRKRGAARTSGS